jgi:ATP-dependent Clp protease ATP-binding subunit ClpC
MLSEKILFGELRPGQIVIVDAEGEGEEASFVFLGVPKADAVPVAAMAEAESAAKPQD